MRPTWVLMLVMASSAFAADPPEAAPDSIAAAKKDLAAVKSLTAPAEQGAALPSLDMKAISPGPGGAAVDAPAAPAPGEASAADPLLKKEGTGNWLVDAMEKKPEPAAGSRGKAGFPRGDPMFDRDPEKTGVRGDGRDEAQDAKERADPRDAKSAAYNPLDAYMSGWISSRDRDLLVPATRGDGTAAADLSKSKAANLPDFEQGLSGDEPAVAFTPVEAALWSDSKPEANPYLSAMEFGPAPAPKVFLRSELPDFAPLDLRGQPAVPGADPASLEAGRSFIPDFAQPSDEDKYFKQMKKF